MFQRYFPLLLCFLLGVTASNAQEVTGTAGSPGATTTISGKQLPPPDPAFQGEIKTDALSSKTWWAPRVVPPKDAPNILLVFCPPFPSMRPLSVARRSTVYDLFM